MSFRKSHGFKSNNHKFAMNNRSANSFGVNFLKDVMKERISVSDEQVAVKFFVSALGFEDLLDLLFCISDSEVDGMKTLKKCYSLIADEDLKLNRYLIPFLELLGKDQLSHGTAKTCVEDCYLTAFKTPGLLKFIHRALSANKVLKPTVVGWFLVAVSRVNNEVCDNPDARGIMELLASTECEVTRAMATLLYPSMIRNDSLKGQRVKIRIATSLEQLEALKPAHDNDYPFDFHKIKILPTAGEINSKVGISDIQSTWISEIGTPQGKEGSLLDRQFRLLREDMIAPMKEELEEYLQSQVRSKTKSSVEPGIKFNPNIASRVFPSPHVVDIECDRVACVIIKVRLPDSLRGRVKGMKRGERVNFFEGVGRRVLGLDAMLAFISEDHVTCVGLVVKRDQKSFATEDGWLVIGVSFEGDHLVTLLSMIEDRSGWGGGGGGGNRNNKANDNFHGGKQIATSVFQASSSYFSYEPVLSCLREMVDIPFAEEIVRGEVPHRLENPLVCPPDIRKKLSSDMSQIEGMHYAMHNRLTLIQGPPGTGKTHVGVQISQALLRSDPQVRILCLCYTNHALDDFLLSLHEDGLALDNIVRIGSSPKINPILKSRCLRDLSEVSFNRTQTRRFAQLKQLKENVEKQISSLKSLAFRRSWGPKWWKTVAPFLLNGTEVQVNAYHQLVVKITNGMNIVGRDGKKINEDYLWQQWCEGRKNTLTTATSTKVSNGIDIWALTKPQRLELRKEWQEEWASPKLKNLAECMVRFQSVVTEIEVLRSETRVSSAQGSRVIGCTTTSAAKNKDLIAQLCPNIVIVEEAAEILEASVLTSLSNSVRQMVMIGDHKQLRPKLECYSLRKESGHGVDFDVSLFERLACQNGFPIISLSVQHRMRPEISEMVRLTTYPYLTDSPNVLGRADLLGFAPNSNVMFITHNVFESENADRAALGVSSKINMHEVDMIVGVLRYLLQQGYDECEIVILTPYLGQLVQIQSALRKLVTVDVNEMDRKDLKRFGVDIESSNSNSKSNRQKNAKAGSNNSNSKQHQNDDDDDEESVGEADNIVNAVRVSTIDNFQGEESRIIIGSLVRSNDTNGKGDIGFVSGPERVNVLLSRARDGLILIGNPETFLNAKSQRGRELWTGILGHLNTHGRIHSGFPILCQQHNVNPARLPTDSTSFIQVSPDGGCCAPCNAVLPSCPVMHVCQKKCHKQLTSSGQNIHINMKCLESVPDSCTQGHPLHRICSESIASKSCQANIYEKCSVGHPMQRKCFQSKILKCKKCADILREEDLRLKRLFEAETKLAAEVQRAQERNQNLFIELQKEKLQVSTDLAKQRLQRENELMELGIATIKNKRQKTIHIKPTIHAENSRIEINQPSTSTNKKIGGDSLPLQLLPEKSNLKAKSAMTMTATFMPSASEDSAGTSVKNTSDSDKVGSLERKSMTSTGASSKEDVTRAMKSLITSPYRADDKSQLQSLTSLAAKEDWLGLHSKASALLRNKEASLYLQAVSDSMFILATLHLSGYSVELQDCIEMIDIVSTLDKVANITLKAVVEFVKFSVTNMNENYQLTAIEFAKQYLTYYSEYLSVIPSSNGNYPVPLLPSLWKSTLELYLHKKETDEKVNSDSTNDNSGGATGSTGMATIRSSIMAKIQQRKNKVTSTASDEWKLCIAEYKAEKAKLPLVSQNKSSPSKADEDTPCPSIDTLMKMTGLESVKLTFLREYHRIKISNEQGVSGASSYNTWCVGNPGTGKTTVARLYSDFLVSMGVLSESSIVKETSGSKLINEGIKGLKAMLEEIKKAEGGVIFVDEAYQLNPQQDQEGRKVLDFILTQAERLQGEYGSVVWIFAGYAKNMEKLFEHNPGLPSRFPTKMTFEDYTFDELLSIFYSLLARGGDDVTSSVKRAPNTTPPVAPKPTTIPLNLNNPYNRYAGNLSDKTDKWGNIWKWDQANYTWVDPYDNITGYGPDHVNPLGSTLNPVVSRKSNISWVFDSYKKQWYDSSNPSNITNVYPGKPKPVVAIKPKQAEFTVSDEKWARIAIRRLESSRDKPGFGNARAVRILFDNARSRQAARLTETRRKGFNPNIFQFERNDLLGPKADRATLEASAAWKELQQMEGLAAVKKSMSALIELVIQNADREENETPLMATALNRVFLGNPGTGKTTVAKLYGKILSELGLLSKGEFHSKMASDFLGSTLGSSESQTRAIIAQAEGGVLVIDEAYSLNPSKGVSTGSADPYKTGVIDTIVEQVQGVPGEDRAVILIGYKKEMEDLMSAANPGLSRRFQMDYAFQFDDYNDEALLRILMAVCKKSQILIDLETATFAIQQLAKARAGPHFGNAGAVNNLLSLAKQNLQSRLSQIPKKERKDELLPEDFCVGGIVPVMGNEQDIFSDLDGCEHILEKLREYQHTIEFAKSQGKSAVAFMGLNFLFVGSPGTGKTTVARRMGQMFYSLGVLPTNEVVQVSASDFVTGYAGQTGKATSKILHEARGKVLFVDEAYQLNPQKGGPYMQEAVDEIVKCLTSEELMGKLVVILAGYDTDIDEMLKVNKGLKSRFSEKIEFHDFDVPTTITMLTKRIRNENLVLSEAALAAIHTASEQLVNAPEFGNGRDIDTLGKKIVVAYACRRGVGGKEVLPEDINSSLDKFLNSKNCKADKSSAMKITDDKNTNKVKKIQQQKMQFDTQVFVPPVTQTTIALQEEEEVDDDNIDDDELMDDDDDDDLEKRFGRELQTLLDQRGLNNQEGVLELSTLAVDDLRFQELAIEISDLLDIPVDEAIALLVKWQSGQESVRDLLEQYEEELEQAKLMKRKAMVPIWRCGVCGQADLPYIVCYVRPYIVRYEERDLN